MLYWCRREGKESGRRGRERRKRGKERWKERQTRKSGLAKRRDRKGDDVKKWIEREEGKGRC